MINAVQHLPIRQKHLVCTVLVVMVSIIYIYSPGMGKCVRKYQQAGTCPGMKFTYKGTEHCIDPNDYYLAKCDRTYEGYDCTPNENQWCSCYKLIPQEPTCPTSTNVYHKGKCYKLSANLTPLCSTGFDLNPKTTKCEKTDSKALTYRCSTGYTLDGSKCYKMEYTNPQ